MLIWRRYLMTRSMSTSSSATTIEGLRWWERVGPAPKDPILAVSEAFLADSSPLKINLGVGAYRDDEGKPVILQCVRAAEAKISGTQFLEFTGLQALSGTGA
ncbi:unnamed protein product [Camellia sinensis]